MGVLAYASQAYDLHICYVTFLSNHGHVLGHQDSAQQVSGFLCLARSQIAQEVQRLHGWKAGWKGGLFEPDSEATVVTHEPEAQEERLLYLMSEH